MLDTQPNRADSIALAQDAARQLFYAKSGSEPSVYEPQDSQEADAAVHGLRDLFEGLPGSVTSALEAARNSGESLSDDRLQGLAEIAQNADDVEASQIRLCLRTTDLLISHDGLPVRLPHVLGLAMPWLSTKSDDSSTHGRFGIGLMTLRSLSTQIEVHCHPYYVRLGDPTIAPIEPSEFPAEFQETGWTTLRIPLEVNVSSEEIEDWLNRWGEAALLFLNHVSRVTLLTPEGSLISELALARQHHEEVNVSLGSERVSRQYAQATDGRSWMVYRATVPSPPGVKRARKATETTTSLAVALPLWPVEEGKVYAGLPVAPSDLPLFVNAQFDPLTSRQGFADSAWNRALIPLVARLWSEAALNLFSDNPKAAWLTVPIIDDAQTGNISPTVNALEVAVVAQARQQVASQLSFSVSDQGAVSLSQLAVEASPLEGILTEAETASLANLHAALPTAIRDQSGKWRRVLDDWRTAGADLPEPVSIEQALALLEQQDRPPDLTIALVAAALDAKLDKRLLGLPCVIAEDGRHLSLPSSASPETFAEKPIPLAQRLGLITLLHAAHLGQNKAARTVLAWLRECGALLDDTNEHAVIRRLATAGQSGYALSFPLTNEQVQALRDAFETIEPVERATLGPNIGRAIILEAYVYEGKQRRVTTARPTDAYLPSAIDHGTDSFAAAAKQTSGLVWLSDQYGRVLRSSVGRKGVGALQFLRLLGAETTPRIQVHPDLESRYQTERRRGLSISTPGPAGRRQAMRELGATYTLQDYSSPDMFAVVEDIARESSKQRRRKRANALLASLGRAWDRLEAAEVDSAYASYGWQERGPIRAYWLWQAGSIAWLDDERGTQRRPVDLRIRTAGTVAIYGASAPGYLHKELDHPNRRMVLSALGVTNDPGRSELLGRLVELRDETEEHGLTDQSQTDVAVVYQAFAESLAATTNRPDLKSEQVRQAFQRNRLVLTNLGWCSPDNVLDGPPIFGEYRAFVPSVKGTDRLWRTLRLREPSPNDCLEVLRKVARQRQTPDGTEEAILLETLRVLASHYAKGNPMEGRQLARLALWTSKGWMSSRPVYVTDDPVMEAGLRHCLPFWQPGGEIEQFRPLLEPLGVTEIKTTDAEVIDPALAEEDSDTTELFRSALRLLREDLARNDPQLAESMAVPWESLEEFAVSVHPNLALRVHAISGITGEDGVSNVAAKVDTNHRKIFVRHPSVLPRVDAGGRALATLFPGDARHLAQAWRAACDKAEEGREAKLIELAKERSEREQVEIDRHIAEFRERTAEKHTASRKSARRGAGAPSPSEVGSDQRARGAAASSLGALRSLVNPHSLKLLDPQGRVEGTNRNAKATGRTPDQSGQNRNLAEPRQGSSGPRNRSPLAGYSDLDKENVGFELMTMVLGSDLSEIVDLRTQRGVGADAMDKLKGFYELKVYAGSEPDQVTLTNAEVERALSTRTFFLVVVSGLEEGNEAPPTVRIVVDPLRQLHPIPRGAITLSGLHEAKRLVYEFVPQVDSQSTNGE